MGVPVPFPQEKLAHLLKNHADVISGLEASAVQATAAILCRRRRSSSAPSQ